MKKVGSQKHKKAEKKRKRAPGGGRKKIWNEPTVPIITRIPISAKAKLEAIEAAGRNQGMSIARYTVEGLERDGYLKLGEVKLNQPIEEAERKTA